jgi:SM-20-related protein
MFHFIRLTPSVSFPPKGRQSLNLAKTTLVGNNPVLLESLFELIANDIVDQGYRICPDALAKNLTGMLWQHINNLPEQIFKRANIARANDHITNDIIRTDEIC